MAAKVRAAAAAEDRGEIVSWRPRSIPQKALIACAVFEIFFGGARGSLKTDGMLGDWIRHESLYGEHAVGLMIRRSRVQLTETYERAKQIFTPLGFTFNDSQHTCTGPGGGRLRFAYLERDSDAENYQGHSYTRIYVEEIGNFPSPAPIFKLMATLRSAHGVPCGFRSTGNPGGPGHGWVKKRYIDPNPAGWTLIEEEFANPWSGEKLTRRRIFIPGKITDHKLLGPEYVANLQMSGPPELVRAWLEGDWDVVAGAYFPEFSRARHVIVDTPFPKEWRRFTASDWGSSRPFWTGWFVIVQAEMRVQTVTGIPVVLLPGAIVCYREWYGEDPQRPGQNIGLKLSIEEWADGVLKRSAKEEITYDVIDRQVFAEDGGPSLGERASKVELRGKKLKLRPADKQRLPGWNQVRYRLRGDFGPEYSPPMLFFTQFCPDAIRTLAALQHDEVESKFEDAETDGEDHACFAAGTLVMTPHGDMPIESLPKSGLVCTREGVKRYTNAGLTRSHAPRLRLFFSDGSVVVCTPDHRFITENGWTQARNLMGSWLPLAPRSKNSTAVGSTSAVRTFSAVASAFIGPCGSGIAGRFRKAFTSTIATRIDRITGSIIWPFFPRRSTAPSTGTIPSYLPLPELRRPSGTVRQMGVHGTPLMQSGSVKPCSPRSWFESAISAARSIRRTLSTFIEASSAQTPARHVRCVGVEQASAGPVYCLTVRSVGEFLLANGLAVHNCDGIRYGCMSRPRPIATGKPKKRIGPVPGSFDWLVNQGKAAPSSISGYRVE